MAPNKTASDEKYNTPARSPGSCQFAMPNYMFRMSFVWGTVVPFYYYRTLCSCQPRRHEQTKAPPPPGASAHPSSQTGQTQADLPPHSDPQFVLSRTRAWTSALQGGSPLRITVIRIFCPYTGLRDGQNYIISVCIIVDLQCTARGYSNSEFKP